MGNKLQKQYEKSQQATTSLQQQVSALVGQLDDQKKEKDSLSSSRAQLEQQNAEMKAELERMKGESTVPASQHQEVVNQNAALQGELQTVKDMRDSALQQAEAARALQGQNPDGDKMLQ